MVPDCNKILRNILELGIRKLKPETEKITNCFIVLYLLAITHSKRKLAYAAKIQVFWLCLDNFGSYRL